MKKRLISGLALLTICLCGCTSVVLRNNALSQSKTVGDFLTDQVLYNLALYKDYNDCKSANGLPSFIQLSSGGSQVQQSISGQLGLKIVTGIGEEDPQVSGTHQSQDNWSFTPVVDPNQIQRLHYLYLAEFKNITKNELNIIFPPTPTPLDQQGRPYLSYTPLTNADGTVVMSNGVPQFMARPITNQPPSISMIPGAILANGGVNDGWFTIDTEPTNSFEHFNMGSYNHHTIWITNKENFFKFALLILGGTNVMATSSQSTPLLQIQNGLLLRIQ
jgi:hypothetical protein